MTKETYVVLGMTIIIVSLIVFLFSMIKIKIRQKKLLKEIEEYHKWRKEARLIEKEKLNKKLFTHAVNTFNESLNKR